MKKDTGKDERALKEIFGELESRYKDFSDLKRLDQLPDIPKVPGAYLIYESGEIIYAGSSADLRRRLGQDLLRGRHALRKKLARELGNEEAYPRHDFAARDFLRRCSFRYSVCGSPSEARLLEALCVVLHSPKYNG